MTITTDVVTASLTAYTDHAHDYAAWAATLPMTAQLDQFTAALPAGSTILDAGCGSGRDLAELTARGYQSIGIDKTAALADIARANNPGTTVHDGDLRHMPQFGTGTLDGIWSCASLVHMPPAEATLALTEFARTLRADGRLFVTVKAGDGTGDWADTDHGRRWFHYWTANQFAIAVLNAGFHITAITRTGTGARTWLEVHATRP